MKPIHILITLLISQAQCQQTPPHPEIPAWQKICLVIGILLVVIAAGLYASRRRNIDMRELLRGYIVPAQAEVTFVNFKNENDRGTETVIETSHTADKSFEDNMSRDEELSIAGAETENRQLSSVFEQKQGTKSKKSKSRKRLAAAAKLTNPGEQQNSQISQENTDL